MFGAIVPHPVTVSGMIHIFIHILKRHAVAGNVVGFILRVFISIFRIEATILSSLEGNHQKSRSFAAFPFLRQRTL